MKNNHCDDLTPLIPSNGSSFDLSGDAEYFGNPYRNKHKKSSSSSSSGEQKNHQRRASTGSNNKKKLQVCNQHSTFSYPSLSSTNHSSKKERTDYSSIEHECSGSAKLSPIAGSSSLHSVEAGESSMSKNTRNSSRRRKLRGEEKRREWLKRWRRRRLFGAIILSVIYLVLGAYTVLITAGPLVLSYWIDPIVWCPTYLDEFGEASLLQKTSKDVHENLTSDEGDSSKYENPDYNYTPCHITRIPLLLYLTLEECDLSRRMAASVLIGGLIGYERRESDRPAGIRTMALVSLGSCFFTISSMLAFRASPMGWDSSRVAAAIPSGVGFLGAGLIWKGTLKDGSGAEVHQVHGITTAASVWLSAAVGVGAGGALYAVSAYSTALVILVLRYGPRLYLASDKGFEDDDDELTDEEDGDDKNNDPDRCHDYNQPVGNDTVSENKDSPSQNHAMRQRQDTAALKRDEKERYGATADIEVNSVAHLLQKEQQRQIERLNSRNKTLGSSQPPFFSWLENTISGKAQGRQRPQNPYQELYNDREVMRMLKRKKSLGSLKSRPSFCT